MPMRRFPIFVRAMLGLLATVQMAVPAIVTLADARLAAASVGTAQAHVEDHTGRGCRAVHPEDCALCQLLAQSGASCAPVPAVPSSRIVRRCVREHGVSAVARFTVALQRTRAPPVG